MSPALALRRSWSTACRILFMRSKLQARKLARQLIDAGVPSVDLHGNLSQPARDRNLAAFSSGEARVLVGTDIAARGVNVDDVQLVVHVDPPAEHKASLHRSGRTARAGSAGDVVTVVLPEQRRDTSALMKRAGISVSPQQVTAASDPVVELVGEIAPYQAPAPRTAHVQPTQHSQPRRRPNRGGERAKAARSQQRSGGRGGHRAGARTGASRSY